MSYNQLCELHDLYDVAKGPFTHLATPDEVQVIREYEFGGIDTIAAYDAPVWIGVDQQEYDHQRMAEDTWGFVL